jgi:hypothetical protein
MMLNKMTAKCLAAAPLVVAFILAHAPGLMWAQGPLDLNVPGVQLMSYALNGDPASAGRRIFQHVFRGGAYQSAWMSGRFPGIADDSFGSVSVRLGDLDNDGTREAVASVYYLTREEKVKGSVTSYYNFKILGYGNGCASDSEPDFESPLLGEMAGMIINDSIIADVDNGGTPGMPHNELVLARSAKVSQIDLCRLNGTTWSVERVADLAHYLFNIDAGDVDGDEANEIVATSQGAPYPIILKYYGGTWLKIFPDAAPTSVLQAKARDTDRDGTKEIIALGGNGRFFVWKYGSGRYGLVASVDTGASSLRGIDAGDFDGDGYNEIILATAGDRKTVPRILRYDFSGGWYVQTASYPLELSVMEIVLGNLDGAPGAEIGLRCYPSGVKVLGMIGGSLLPVYSAPNWDAKIEIR